MLITLFVNNNVVAQNQKMDSLVNKADSLFNSDAVQQKIEKKKSSMDLKSKAIYLADDSLIMDRENEMLYLYHNAVVNYDGIILKAEYIELDFKKNTVYAIGVPDSTGEIIGAPVFKDAGEEYQAGIIEYNFDSKKGLISDVTKNQGDVFIWMKKGKKLPSDIIYVETGHFTTCSAKHPHYRIKFKKGKVIPDDKIVTGPIYIEVEDVPLPFVMPFGFIPNTSSRSNGILVPSYGYSENRGYNLTNGGYYWGLGDHADLQLRGDIYTRGSWAIKALTRYNFRYRGNGSVALNYAYNKYGETDTKNYNEDQTFQFKWSHRQDPKANPYSSFTANVNFASKNYNKLNPATSQDYLTNTIMSSISYSARFGNGYNFTGSFNHSQNSKSGDIDMTLPQISFSTPRFYPFQRKNGMGTKRWYEKISMSYKLDARNNLETNDSVFMQTKWEDFDNGVKHVVPISSTVNMGSFNWTNSVNLTERWYLQSVNKYYENDTTIVEGEIVPPHLVTDRSQGFNAVHEFDYNSSITTRIYGMYMAKNSPLALRHVITPTLSFNYHPDFGVEPFNYYQEYTNDKGEVIRYSMYDGMMYGSPNDGKSGSVGLYFDNTFELKIPFGKDTINGGTKKIKILDNLRFGTRYNLAAEEFALAPLEVSARTTIFKGLSVRYAGYWDFYAVDTAGVRVNEFIWNVTPNTYLRKKKSTFNLSFNYNLNSGTFKKKRDKKKKDYESNIGTEAELEEINSHKFDYVDFNNNWSANFSYSFAYKEIYNLSLQQFDYDFVQTLNFRGSINITKKWKIGGSTGYDFKSGELTYTSVDIYRDLHCWELMFNWIPMGFNRSYNITLRIKSPLLQDLKLNRKRNWRDY